MWTVIIIIVIVVIAISFISNQQQSKEIQNHHISQGGFRKSFPVFTNHLENYYEMTFASDTGSIFCYSKEVNDTNKNIGTLTIGIKYNMTTQPILFSNYKNAFKTEFQGMDVSNLNFDSVEEIDRCINISIDKIKSQGILAYENSKNKITKHSEQTQFLLKWQEITKDLGDGIYSENMRYFINHFFIPDSIEATKFMENLDVLQNTWKGLEGDYGTKSVKGLYSIPPAFNMFFVAAYPDVYLWYQKNADTKTIEIQNKISDLTADQLGEYFSNPIKIAEFYRSLITQYKREVSKLECST